MTTDYSLSSLVAYTAFALQFLLLVQVNQVEPIRRVAKVEILFRVSHVYD